MEKNIRVALIGTGWITKKMLDATKTIGGIEITGIYSRDEEKTRMIGRKWGIKHIYQSVDELIHDTVDFVYLAAPTKNHYGLLQTLIQHKIPVLCEKPIVVNLNQFNDIIDSSVKCKSIVMEAMKTIYTPNFKLLQSSMSLIGQPTRVYFTFERPSIGSVDDRYRSALLDVGVYPIAVSVALFGVPKMIESKLKLIANKMDVEGHVVLGYDGFDVTIDYSKEVLSDNLNRIIGTDGTLLFEHVSEVRSVKYLNHDGSITDLTVPMYTNTLVYELLHMIELVHDSNKDGLVVCENEIRNVLKIMDEIRMQHQIIFDED